jgi:hypothetical protein
VKEFEMSSLNRSRLTKEERAHRAYTDKVRALIMTTFGLSEQEMVEQDRTWSKWCAERKSLELSGLLDSSRGNEYTQLWHLVIHGGIQDCFKARIFAILLAPRIHLAPFSCESSFPEESYTQDWLGYNSYAIKMIDLPSSLHAFLATLLETTLDAFDWKRVTLKKASPYFGEKGIERYNQLILQALPILPVESVQAERLFGCYKMAYPHESGPKQLGDSFFQEMLGASIPIEWKLRADAERRAHIWRHRPHCEPLFEESWKSLIRGYTHDVQTLLSAVEKTDAQVLEGQISWLIGLAASRDLPPVWWHDSFTRTLSLLPKEWYKDLRQRFAWHILFSEPPVLLSRTRTVPVLHDAEDCRVVRELIEELGDGNERLLWRLRKMIELYEMEVANREAKLADIKAAEQAMC